MDYNSLLRTAEDLTTETVKEQQIEQQREINKNHWLNSRDTQQLIAYLELNFNETEQTLLNRHSSMSEIELRSSIAILAEIQLVLKYIKT